MKTLIASLMLVGTLAACGQLEEQATATDCQRMCERDQECGTDFRLDECLSSCADVPNKSVQCKVDFKKDVDCWANENISCDDRWKDCQDLWYVAAKSCDFN